MQDFVHLHVHTQYSILDGQASIPKLVDKAIADGMRGIAVTDHGNMMGIKEFINYVNKKNGGVNGEIKDLKKRGVWVYAADMDGEAWCGVDMTGPCAVVVGSEGHGVGRLVRENCDFIVSLPMKGKINSLNASVACGIVCYEVARQRAGMKARN